MPTFTYKAITKRGARVKNTVEENSKLILYRKLKQNGLSPISITQTQVFNRRTQVNKKKRNTDSSRQEIMRAMNSAELSSSSKKMSSVDKVKSYFAMQQKITPRDLVVFTQNFYLLKKANFNNVHALTTIIDSTENVAFIGVLEDILAGVEAGDYMYKTMEYYSGVFPFIYTNMIKVGELSGSLENSLQQAVEYLDNATAINKKIKGILIPNIAQFILLMAVLMVGTVYALPQIEKVLEDLGADENVIPPTTRWFQGVVENMMIYWPIPVRYYCCNNNRSGYLCTYT